MSFWHTLHSKFSLFTTFLDAIECEWRWWRGREKRRASVWTSYGKPQQIPRYRKTTSSETVNIKSFRVSTHSVIKFEIEFVSLNTILIFPLSVDGIYAGIRFVRPYYFEFIAHVSSVCEFFHRFKISLILLNPS